MHALSTELVTLATLPATSYDRDYQVLADKYSLTADLPSRCGKNGSAPGFCAGGDFPASTEPSSTRIFPDVFGLATAASYFRAVGPRCHAAAHLPQ